MSRTRGVVTNRLELALPQANSQGIHARLSYRPVEQSTKAKLEMCADWNLPMSYQENTGAQANTRARVMGSLAILVLMLVMAPAVKADPIQIITSSSGFQLLGMGNNGHGTTNPDFDALYGAAHSASHIVDSAGGSFTTVINPLLFTAGFTGFGSGGTYHFNFSQLLTVNGQTQTLNMLATLTVTAIEDTVTVVATDPLIFQFDTFTVAAHVLPVTMYGTENGQFRDFLCARFEVMPKCDTTVPEPTTMLLLGTGLAGIAAKIRKRRKAKAGV